MVYWGPVVVSVWNRAGFGGVLRLACGDLHDGNEIQALRKLVPADLAEIHVTLTDDGTDSSPRCGFEAGGHNSSMTCKWKTCL